MNTIISRGTRRVGSWSGRLGRRVVLLLLSVVMVYPLFWTIASSLKTNAEILGGSWGLPAKIVLDNYVQAFKTARMGSYLGNSLYVTAGSSALLLFLCMTSSYALVRLKSVAARIISLTYMCGLFIQVPILMVSIFLLLANMGMIDSRESLILVYVMAATPFSVYLLTAYLSSIPRDFEESAQIDGASRWRILFYVVAPLAQPGLITVMVFNLFYFWNEYPIALTLVFSDAKYTVPIGLANLFEVERYATNWGALFAGLSLVLFPTFLVYILTQKRLTSGMMVGGLKG